MSFDEIELPDRSPGNFLYGTQIGYGNHHGRPGALYSGWDDYLTARLVKSGRSTVRKKIQIRVQRSEEYITWKSMDDVHKTIAELTEGMPEGTWEISLENTERAYEEGTYGELVATCWRAPTEEEAQIVRDHIATLIEETERRQREQDERLIRELKERRPDLLPTTFLQP